MKLKLETLQMKGEKVDIPVNKLLYWTLSQIKELDSPQVTTHLESVDSKPVSFSFRFKNIDLENPIYLKLINVISNYEGEIAWVMYNFRSRKNYVIEPLMLYFHRRLQEEKERPKLKDSFEPDQYEGIIQSAINDIPSLCYKVESCLIL